ncbi:hypothetical protein [Mycoplasma sp. VS1572C]
MFDKKNKNWFIVFSILLAIMIVFVIACFTLIILGSTKYVNTDLFEPLLYSGLGFSLGVALIRIVTMFYFSAFRDTYSDNWYDAAKYYMNLNKFAKAIYVLMILFYGFMWGYSMLNKSIDDVKNNRKPEDSQNVTMFKD